VLKPGGRLVVLEFSKAINPGIDAAYKTFSRLWPRIGQALTGDYDSYQYLIESIEMHPDQETLKTLFNNAGFVDCHYHNLLNGIAAIHIGNKADRA